MKNILNSLIAVLLLTGGTVSARDAAEPNLTLLVTNGITSNSDASLTGAVSTNSTAANPLAGAGAAEVKGTDLGTNSLRLNFRGASLDQVLSYFSEAAGFVINVKPGTSVRGKVDVWSNEPLTKDEAINLLDTVLNQNGLAAIHNGKTLTIVNKDDAKTQNIPVIQGADPDTIPITDKVVTQIIPVRFVEVAQLLKDLQPLVSSVNSTMTANEAGNSIVITDTQSVIHKVAEIIKAIDAGAEDFTELRVFKLVNADPNDTAELLSNLFPDDSRNGSGQSSAFGGFRSLFGGSRRSFGGGTPGGSSSSSGDANSRIKKRNKLIAVADQRTASVVVSASHDLMDQIAEMIQQLDGNPKGRATVKVYQFQNADPQAVLPILEEMFNKNGSQNNSRNNSSSQNSALMNRNSTQNSQTSSSSRGTTSGGGSRGGSSIGTFGQ
jgi:general secretion pathway protein D